MTSTADMDQRRAAETDEFLNLKFEKEAQAKANRAAALARARAAKAAKKAGPESKEAPAETKTFASITNQIRDEQVWREAMVAQMVNGRCVSPQQLEGCAKLADAYLELVQERFPG